MPMIGWSLRASLHFPHSGFCSSDGARYSFSILPVRTPPSSVIRTSAFGLPVLSSMVFQVPTGEVACAHAAAGRASMVAAIRLAWIRWRMVVSPVLL